MVVAARLSNAEQRADEPILTITGPITVHLAATSTACGSKKRGGLLRPKFARDIGLV